MQGSFAATALVMRTLESVAVAISQQEAPLLVGETGTGKTTLVQKLADQVSNSWCFAIDSLTSLFLNSLMQCSDLSDVSISMMLDV